jgi:hypothetical protein
VEKEIFYLEADEEVTRVVNRIRKSESDSLIFVIPRGGTIGHSLINLKLIKRSAREHKKAFGFVTSDSITQNLSKQQDIPFFGKVSDAEKADFSKLVEEAESFVAVAGMKVKHYKRYDLNKHEEIDATSDETPAEEAFVDDKSDIDSDVEDIEPSEGNTDDSEQVEDEMEPEEEPEAVEDAEEAGFHREKIVQKENKVQETNKKHKPIEKKVIVNAEEAAEEDFGEVEMAEPVDEDYESNQEEKVDDSPQNMVIERKVNDGDSHMKSENSARKKRGWKVVAIVVSALVLVLAAAAYYVVPKSTVSITVETVEQTKDFAATISSNDDAIDLTKTIIPGHYVSLESEQTKSFTATGQKDVGAKATGKVTISNTVSTSAQAIPATLKIVAANGKNFVLQKGVMVPAATLKNCQMVSGAIKCDTEAGVIEADVVAVENGDSYNIGPSQFTVGKLTAESKAAFTGGLTKVETFVTEEDIAKASAATNKEILDKLNTDFAANIAASGYTVCEKCQGNTIVAGSSDQAANAVASTFNYRMKVKVFALGFDEKDMKKYAGDLVESGLQKDEAVVNAEGAELTYKVGEVKIDEGTMAVAGTIKAKVGKKLDIAVIRSNTKNKSVSAAESYIKGLPGVKVSTISVSPAFLKMMPINDKNIEVKFDFEQ